MQRIWDITGFSGGESDDAFRGPKESFWSAENVEIRKNLSGAYLANGLSDTGWTISGNPTCMVALESIGGGNGIVICTDTGNIYLNGVLKTTISSGLATTNRIRGIGTMIVSGTQYLYYISDTAFGTGQIHRSTTDLATFNTNHRSFTTSAGQSDSKVSIVKKAGNLIFSKNNKVIQLDTLEVVSDKLILPAIEVIVGMSEFQNSYRIYSNFQNTGVQYIWDGYNEVPDYRQEWVNQPVLGVANDGAFDYAILGFNAQYSDLYLISGTQKQELRVNLESASYSRIFTGDISVRESIVYISGGLSGESNNYGIYTFGNYYPGTAKSLVQSYSKPAIFTLHSHLASSSYFACSDGKIYSSDHNAIPINGYTPSGFITTQVYQGNLWEDKRFDNIKVGFKLESGSEIKIYLRTSFLGTWQLAKTIDWATYGAKKSCKITQSEVAGLNLGNFNELQMKIELIAGSSSGTNNKTPTINRITTFLETVNL